MASPRQLFRYDEIEPKQLVPFACGTGLEYESGPSYGTSHKNAPVKVNAAGEVVLAADGDEVVGLLELVTRGTPSATATVQTAGVREVKCKSAATFTANQRVVADDAGGVKPAATAGTGTGKVWYKNSSTTVIVQF